MCVLIYLIKSVIPLKTALLVSLLPIFHADLNAYPFYIYIVLVFTQHC